MLAFCSPRARSDQCVESLAVSDHLELVTCVVGVTRRTADALVGGQELKDGLWRPEIGKTCVAAIHAVTSPRGMRCDVRPRGPCCTVAANPVGSPTHSASVRMTGLTAIPRRLLRPATAVHTS